MVKIFGFLFDKDTWQEVQGSLKKNTLRSILTMVGVWWGILLLIGLLGSARGIENNFNVLFEDFATNSVFVGGGKTSMPFKGYEEGRPVILRLDDVKKVEENVEGIELVVPRIMGNAVLSRKIFSGSFNTTGDFPILNEVAKPDLTLGRFINQSDIDEQKKVVVISEDVYKQLFEKDEDPIGELISVSKTNFKVIGVFKLVNFGGPQLDVHMPFTTFQQLYNRGDRIDWMMITGKPEYNINQVEADVKLLLKNLKKVNPNDNRAFFGFNLGDRFSQFTGFLKGMQFLTWFVGIATLIAGVFAIGSILLITVKERTKEIGIRRALGATPIMIKRQIIVESVTLAIIAGFIGIISGGVILMLINNAMLNSNEPWMRNPSVSIGMVFLSLLIVVILGTLIGLIPANKATSVKPIDALREE
ncbi:ABC transporter permease [Seonamhaeicola aphaedonensis]|uniref:Putative ABC transport system permease protein n=1 Tax=Seonamhaeicola aphaedonensis TaxID=1461338 RepID=A0A3D9HGQ7_9FLAO|nr:ABC transporter permease [Seonamhaeicola aphaedonensis]RED48678.1 putative ABC transport system permease protein [Seonamhaeicola aphaedonensis]